MTLQRLVPISGNGFILRSLTIADAESLADIEFDGDVKRFLASPTTNRTEWLRKFDPSTYDAYAIDVDGILAGRISLFRYRPGRKGYAEVAILLDRAYWNQHLGRKVFELLIRVAFNDLKLRGLVAVVHPQNIPSLKLLRRHGFKRRGTITNSIQEWQLGHFVYRLPRNVANQFFLN